MKTSIIVFDFIRAGIKLKSTVSVADTHSTGPLVYCLEISLLRINPFSCPKLGEDQKKRSSLKFSPVFGPKLGGDQKKRSSLGFSPIFRPKLDEDQK